ncbi:preprotein translocase subunit YajC [Promicromonospora sp. AC04]|uniref:preprotein translocase subunit YajC n=1 Tax=Promicromonospora sp. AC04 TaxID=2135723 RepID=UPI000D3BDD31|nr:preprotein translocase subunit YajC [Promicromonospora sp. AC04]PUB25435.1 preprotein translocase subunit YajC [Promicromonospora sp. AC04]
MLILVAILLVAMFFMSSRSRKQQRAAAEFRNNLTVGTKVMTASGMIGTVVDVDDANDQVTIESFPGNPTTWLRAAISKQIDEPVADDADAEDATDESEVTENSETASTISPDANDVPDDLSGLDTAKREYREQQRRDADADGK